MREFLGRSRQLGGDHFEHAGRIQEAETRIQKGFDHGFTWMNTDTGLNGSARYSVRNVNLPLPMESRGGWWRGRSGEDNL